MRSIGNYTPDGVSYDSKCRKYFSPNAYSGVGMWSALWMAVWFVMWDFDAAFIQYVYRNATGCDSSGNALRIGGIWGDHRSLYAWNPGRKADCENL